jgi:pyruvate dehydrogenase E1 component beta subunit
MVLGYQAGEVPTSDYVVPIGKAITRREGKDVTIVSYAKTVHHCLQAAETLAGEGISAEVIDLRSLKPLDENSILDSVRRTGRMVVVHEASRMCGVGSEIAAIVSEKAFGALKAPILRITGPDAPAPSSHLLEQAFIPQADTVAAAVRRLFDRELPS